MIDDFRDKRLAAYLEPGQRVLIRFGHGLGDCLMFAPCLNALRAQFPETQIDLYVENGQEEVWPSVAGKDAPGYDLVFSLPFSMSWSEFRRTECEAPPSHVAPLASSWKGANLTKQEQCCRDELGIEPPAREWAFLPDCESPLVGVHFQGTALPGSVNWPEWAAKQVWDEIMAFGKTPIECYYAHIFDNPANAKYDFVDPTLRNVPGKLSSLIGLLQRCWAFIGVASGPWCTAMAIMPERTLFLQKDHRAEGYTHEPVARLTLDDFREGQVTTWLNSLTS